MQSIVNVEIVELWTILDLSSDPLTGMTTPAEITFTLHRQTGSVMEAADEAITFTEVGSSGHYTIAFTPTVVGLYVLQLKEVGATTQQRTWRFHDFDVVSAGAAFAPSYTKAFCAKADLERWLQYTITATTEPSSDEATGFAEARAAVLMSLCAGWGFSVTPATVVAGSRIEDMLREANAIGASMDYTVAQQFGVQPSLSQRGPALGALWVEYVGGARPGFVTETEGYLEKEIKRNLSSLASDYIISGDTADRPAETPPTNAPIGIGMGDLF